MDETMTALLQAPARALFLRGTLTFLDGTSQTLVPKDLLSASVREGAEDGFLLGAVLACSCGARLENSLGQWLPGGARRGQRTLLNARVFLELGVAGANETRYLPLCAFRVEAVSSPQCGALTLSGTGLLPAAFDDAFSDPLTYPTTLGALARALANAGGAPLSAAPIQGDGLTVTGRPDFRGLTIREALSDTLAAAGCFAFCAPDGTLRVRPVKDAGAPFSVPRGQILSMDAPEPVFGPLRAVELIHRDGTRNTFSADGAAATPLSAVYLSENPLLLKGTEQMALIGAALLDALSGLTLPAGRVTFKGEPQVLLGDTLRVEDRLGQSWLLPVTARTLDFSNGGFSMTASCTVSSASLTVSGASQSGRVRSSRLLGQIDGASLTAGTVSASALIAGSITGAYLSAACVSADKLAAQSVSADKLTSSSVTAEKLAAQSVSTDKLAAQSVSAEKLASSSVTAEKLAAGAVTAAAVKTGSLTADRLAAGTITAQSGVLADACVGSAQLSDLSVTDAKIVSLSASKLTAGVIDANVISVENLTADNIVTGTLNGQVIPVLGADKLSPGAVTGEKLAQGAVTADKLVAGSVTADKLAASSVNAEKILSGSVTADKLAASSVTADKVVAGSLTAACLSADVGQALDLSSNTSVTARVLSNAAVTIDAEGIALSGGRVIMNTDSFDLSTLKDGAQIMHIGREGIDARVISADEVLSSSVLRAWHKESGAAEFSGSVQSSLDNLPKYLTRDVTLTVPAGSYIEQMDVAGFLGPGSLTILLSEGVMVFGGVSFSGNLCPVTLSGGLICATGEACVTASNNERLTLLGVRLFGAARASKTDAARTITGFAAHGGYALLSSVEINRVDDCVSAQSGARVRVENATGGAIHGYTCENPASLALRDKPSDTYTRLATIPANTLLYMETDVITNGFYCVLYQGFEGYVPFSSVIDVYAQSGSYQTAANLGYAFRASRLSVVSFSGSRPQAAHDAFPGTLNALGDGMALGSGQSTPTNALSPVTPGMQLTFGSLCAYCLRTPLDSAPREGLPPMQGSYRGYAVAPATGVSYLTTITCRGAWFLENAGDIAGKAISGATLTIRRAKTGGESGKKTIALFGHGRALSAGQTLFSFPDLFSLNVSVSLDLDEEATVALPAAAVQQLIDGTLKGFGTGPQGDLVTMTDTCVLRLT